VWNQPEVSLLLNAMSQYAFVGIGLAELASSLTWVCVAQFWLGLAGGVGYPTLVGLSIERVADRERTTAMGLHQAVYAVGMFGGPWLRGLLADAIGLRPMFGVTAFAVLALGWLGTHWLSR